MPATELLISADSHANLTQDMVKGHLATRWHAAYDDAVDAFTQSMQRGAGAVNQAWQTQKPKESENSFRLRNMRRPGHMDGRIRLDDMDLDGVEQEIIYCEVSAFRYLYTMKEGAAEATTAFNDAMREYGSPNPNRLIVSYQIPIHDIEGAITEVQRVVALGAKSLQLPVFPPELGVPDYHHERYEPLFALIQETGLPVCCHIGLNTMLADLTHRDPTPSSAITVPMFALSAGEALGMWILGGVFEKFPKLKVVFVEPGLGWIAWWLYIVDDMYGRQGYEIPTITKRPSEYFHSNVFTTFIDEPDAVQSDILRHRLGVENIMWSSDYPHPVSSWPNSRSIVNDTFATIPAAERELILSGNAKRVWNL